MRLAWITDIHLNFLDDAAAEAFFDRVVAADADAILVGGDIAVAPSLEKWLKRMDRKFARPTWFVLGNHDFYGGAVAEVRDRVTQLSQKSRHVKWLGAAGVVELTPTAALVGHDGWGDARLGDHWNSDVRLNDFSHIEDLAWMGKPQLAERLASLGDESATHLRKFVPDAVARYEHVVVLTHVPPFREACWHEGKISTDHWLPYFTCKAVGDVLLEAMKARPYRRMTVLCGHTHGSGECRPLPNLRVVTGGAEYGKPAVQPVLEV